MNLLFGIIFVDFWRHIQKYKNSGKIWLKLFPLKDPLLGGGLSTHMYDSKIFQKFLWEEPQTPLQQIFMIALSDSGRAATTIFYK